MSGKFPPGQFSPGEPPLPPVNYHLTKFSLGEFPPGSGLGNLTRWEFTGGNWPRGGGRGVPSSQYLYRCINIRRFEKWDSRSKYQLWRKNWELNLEIFQLFLWFFEFLDFSLIFKHASVITRESCLNQKEFNKQSYFVFRHFK